MAVSLFSFWLGSCGLANAGVEAVHLFINTFVTNYTVPAGKVLLIEHVVASAADNTPTPSRILLQTKIFNIVNNGISTTYWGFPVSDKFQTVTLVRPLRIPAGGSLGIDPVNGYNNVRMLGLLIDVADLYAANVEGSVEEVKVAAGTLSTKVALASARPVRISSQVSPDLNSWSANPSEQKQRNATDPARWQVQAGVQGDKEFLKVAARAPETVPGVSP